MDSRVAVVTDSVSDGFYFPLFLSHYRQELPGADIFVVTPAGRASMFDDFGLAGVVELSIDFYDDTVRAGAISDLVSDLTQRYTHVLRVDCDEFAIADPRRFPSLQAYIDVMPRDYVTALGYDVVAAPSDAPLDFTQPILGAQRRYAFALNALNKTCLTRVPLRWGRGFHACQQRPDFDSLFLMHLKRADIDMQFNFGQFIAGLTREDTYIRKYYQTPKSEIIGFHNNLFQHEKSTGWSKFIDQKFLANFFLGLRKSPDSGLWDIEYKTSNHLVEIPAEFHGKIGPVPSAPPALDENRPPNTSPARAANEDQELLAAAAALLLAIERRMAAAVPELKLAAPSEMQARALTRLSPAILAEQNARGPFDAEKLPAVLMESHRRVEAAIGAITALLTRVRKEAGFRELSLRRRLVKADRALTDPQTLPAYRAYTDDRLWFSVDRKDANCIAGWAMVTTNPEQRVRVDLLTDGNLIASQTADKLQPHLLGFGYGDGNYGFRFEFDAKADIARTGARIVATWGQEEMELGVLEPAPRSAEPAAPS